MEWMFFLIFGGLLLFFFGYGVKLYSEDKKIIDGFKELQNGRNGSEKVDLLN